MAQRYVALDGLRGLLALTVAIGHGLFEFGFLTRTAPEHWGLLAPFAYLQVAVSTFFVLSGFVLDRVYSSWPGSFRTYITARIARIWPLNVFTLLIIAPLLFFIPDQPDASAEFVRGLLFLNGPWGRIYLWNPPAWSLSVEWHLYLVFPLLLVVAARLHLSGLVLFISGTALMAVHVWLFTSPEIDSLHHPPVLIRGLGAFLAGMGISRLRPRSCNLLLPITIMALFASMYSGMDHFTTTLFAPLLVLAVMWNSGDALERPAFIKLGDWSYSIYMLHYPVLIALKAFSFQLFGVFTVNYMYSLGPYISVPVLLTYCATVLALSRLCYERIECPARSYIRGLARSRRSGAEIPH